MPPPRIALIGPMGSGKTTLGRALAKSLAYDFFDNDQEIESAAGVDVSWIFDAEGEQGFRQREHTHLIRLTTLPSCVIATGGGAIPIAKIFPFSVVLDL